jgi:hypothetical protein
MLRQESQIKNQQIPQQTQMLGKQMELIDGLSERLREGNILIGSLQQRLALTDGTGRKKPESEIVVNAKKGGGETSGRSKSARASTPPKKRGLFRRMFREQIRFLSVVLSHSQPMRKNCWQNGFLMTRYSHRLAFETA